MARFRCCGNHSTAGHAADCSLKPPDYTPPTIKTRTEGDREEDEKGCQFDILHFKHIGTCKGTCEGEGEQARFQDPNTLVIIMVEIDPDDPMLAQKLQELERRGFHRLTDEEAAALLAAHERGDVKLEVKTMTLDELEEQTRAPDHDDPFLTIQECAEILGFSLSWTRTLCRRGRFEGAIKLMKKWAIPQSAVLVED